MNPETGFFLIGGIFFLGAIALRFESFRSHYKVRGLVKRLGRTGATVFYIAWGLAFVAVGILTKMGIITFD